MKIVIGIILLAAGLSVYCFPRWLSPHLPTDEELATRFFAERESFDKLGRLLIDDTTLLFVSPSRFHRQVGYGKLADFDPSDEYKTAFKRTGILHGRSARGSYLEFIEFTTYRVKLADGDFNQQNYEEKGYALMVSPPEKVQELLGVENTYSTKFRQIEGQWFVYQGIRVGKPE